MVGVVASLDGSVVSLAGASLEGTTAGGTEFVEFVRGGGASTAAVVVALGLESAGAAGFVTSSAAEGKKKKRKI